MRQFPWWLVIGSVFIAALYVPMLSSPFDCTEDSCLVYPPDADTPSGLVRSIAHATWTEYRMTGPFRPVSWAHWQVAAALFGPDPAARRATRLVWCVLATASLLLLLTELGASPPAALIAAAFAMWNPFRSEIWIGLGMPEAFAMPYALLALLCATRAARSSRPLGWDVAGLSLLLLCLGIKNVYIALIPAIAWLRVAGGTRPWRGEIGRGMMYVALAALPVVHFILIKVDPRPTHFQTGVSVAQGIKFVRALYTAFGVGVLWPALLLLLAVVPWQAIQRARVALVAAGLLLAAGFAVYLPVPMMYPRYTMPSVWGLDVAFALALTIALADPTGVARRLTVAAVALALVVIGWRGLVRQDLIVTRNRVNWQAMTELEKQAGGRTRAAVVHAPDDATTHLDISRGEAFHVIGHLRQRGRSRADLVQSTGPQGAALVLGGERYDPGAGYVILREFRAERILGGGPFRCRLWQRVGP